MKMLRPGLKILDGGLSTQLENHHGVDLTKYPKLWTAGLLADAAGRAKLRAAHDAYYAAGASVILSSSYQTSPGTDTAALAASIELALDARDAAAPGAEAWVSCGPYGATLADGSEYRGDYALGEAALREWHGARLAGLLPPDAPRRPDGLAFETLPSMPEVRAILSLLAEPRWREMPAWLSFQCRDGSHLADGTPVADAVSACRAAFAARGPARSLLGANCVSPAIVHELLDALLAPAAEGALSGVVLYPNDGGTWNATERCWECVGGERSFADALAGEWAGRIRASGLEAIIGGCCSTDQCTVRALSRALRAGCAGE
ncbi:hypothetical protein EMIHUDRAFT_199689 [Emiliania huxleyi CCMP1516]|uniref:Hcy-binding domain-containing protein n=2 Tax=Emiliania huxleyi TaxID=2903 RepID=A0A0D3L023_EMIH1|nr:hypothetical protein EMIHUDRAFT_199689 [Emiliania huxleyi CCMP1516]EOD41358.1 hypothetical protein EMIHUDRAFT_199689 [Emiliania huxleyi CCMP1516]|eukprot:XP_005793787.1 hypothetical protein EMIHUDRAFT_199689 [Emiliania huxleyi CCMP1516]